MSGVATVKPALRLAYLRQKAGLTQLEMSQKLNVTQNTYQNWERNRAGVAQIERVILLCKILKCQPSDLLSKDNPLSEYGLTANN